MIGVSWFSINKNSDRFLRFRWTPKASLIPLQTKLARTHEKKMWFTDSTWSHRAQLPSELSWQRLICSFAGIFPLAICQRKILIFKGSFAFQISFSWGRLGPWLILRYKDETENFPLDLRPMLPGQRQLRDSPEGALALKAPKLPALPAQKIV
jgi:hypothetical protein